ncbi:pre-rRNA-processing protein ESF1 [Saccharomyces eubayanus]|uniref:pre-rRNA-processing protein ESF1 n=1 Tax=Saccharomyces eubayanus TaxID=1080349 RepID=UPI0006C65BFA|nr:ESF1-like protein [Saccharomyces eubayanus]KOH01187.1 ESF1-like protein [Saccharomyces eubayanus]
MAVDKPEKESVDARFAGIYNDPKFKNTRTRDHKIKLDSRFSKKDLEVQHKSKVDKYGRKIKDAHNTKEMEDFDKYFEKEAEDDEDAEADVKATVDRARGEVPNDYVSSGDEFTSSDSESSGESEVESEEESEVEAENAKPESGDASKTLAVVNLDWDHVKSEDLMITFSGFVPKGGKIERISVYPSEFGKERMQREEVEGPPKELFQRKKQDKASKKKTTDDSDSDIDIGIKDLYEEGDADKDVDSRALRQYQLDRLRYYYAVVYCSDISTARAIYENCDGTEYESTANMFDLRYVPDGMTFDDTARDECSALPKNYRPHQFSTDALQHSNVKLTWDETPADRVEVAKRAFTQKEIDDMDFKAYLASDSDESDEEVNEDAKSKLKSLVGGLGFNSKKENANDGEEEEVDMEITFTPALEGGDEKPVEGQEETSIEKIRRKEKERRKARKQKVKELKQQSEKEKRGKFKSTNKKHVADEEELKNNAKSKAELELLMDDDGDAEAESSINSKAHFNMNEILRSEKEKHKKSRYQKKERIVEDTFTPDLEDPRFKEVFEDHDFAIDPTQPEYKGTQAMNKILKERGKRVHDRKRKHGNNENDVTKDGNANKNIGNLVNKLKKKSKSSKKIKV